MKQRGQLFVLSGPGGVGKSTIVDEIRRLPNFYFSVSATTRLPRAGEVDGVAYHFVTDSEFDEMVAANKFLEWAEFAGHRYGTPLAPTMAALEQGRDVILEIEIQGARQVKKAVAEAVMIFIAPPSVEELMRRLQGRGTDDPERIRARLALAEQELAAAKEFDHVLVNHQVDQVVAALVSLATSSGSDD